MAKSLFHTDDDEAGAAEGERHESPAGDECRSDSGIVCSAATVPLDCELEDTADGMLAEDSAMEEPKPDMKSGVVPERGRALLLLLQSPSPAVATSWFTVIWSAGGRLC